MSQNDIESYEDIFTFLDGSVDDWTRFSETWFKDKLIKEVTPKWYENKWLWFGMGVVGTAIIVK